MPVLADGPENEAPLRLIRLLINDTATEEADQVFSNTELLDFLALEGDDVKRAAAQALDTIADNEALVSKAIRTQDLQTDGPKVAESLRKRATELRAQADRADEAAEGDYFDVIDLEAADGRPERTAWPC